MDYTADVGGETPKAVVLLSGGMDSTTLLYHVKNEGYLPVGLSVHYGQRHSVELKFAAVQAEKMGIKHHIVDLSAIKELVRSSSLTSDAPVPEGHYAADNMAQTVVPNRNAILLALAYGLAVTVKAAKVCTAVHAGDHAIYPDCRPEFIRAFEEMERKSITREIYQMRTPQLYAPFVMLSKADIAAMGQRLGVPWTDTWSCYKGDIEAGHCGRCGTCVERAEAFKLAGIPDPTKYADPDFANTLLSK